MFNNILNNLSNQKVKIIFIMATAFVLSVGLSNTVFLAGTPRINKPFLAKLVNLPGTVVNNSTTFIASILNPQDTLIKEKINQFSILPVDTMQKIASGVYAQDDQKNDILYIKITKDAQWEERIMNINGKQVKARFPKGIFK